MNLLDHTTTWVKGEVFQGRIMIILGVIVFICFLALFRSSSDLLRGMTIPVGLVLLILLGYGGYQVFARPPHVNKVSDLLDKNPKQAIEQEYTKAQKDNKTYLMLKKVWVALIIVSALSYLGFASPYLHGLSLGCVGMFFTALLMDSILHQRLLTYMRALEKLAQ